MQSYESEHKHRGRPKSEKSLSQGFRVRLTPTDHETLRKFSEMKNISMSTAIRVGLAFLYSTEPDFYHIAEEVENGK